MSDSSHPLGAQIPPPQPPRRPNTVTQSHPIRRPATYNPLSPTSSTAPAISKPLVRPVRPRSAISPSRNSLLFGAAGRVRGANSVYSVGGSIVGGAGAAGGGGRENRPTLRNGGIVAVGTRSMSPPAVRGAGASMTSTNGTTARLGMGQPHPQSLAQHTLLSTQPREKDLKNFAKLCRELYYNKDAGAAQAVDQILQRLPASSRTAYARTMSSIRSQFHADTARSLRTLVESTLASSHPGSKIMKALKVSEGGINTMRSSLARKNRKELLKGFIKNYGERGLVGTQPFLKSLCAVLWLQGLPVGKGGAGKRRVEWEVDVAVFSEAGGGSWMIDSIEILKAILGFNEVVKDSPPDSLYDADEVRDEGDAGINSPPFGATSSPSTTDDEEEPLDEGVDIFQSSPPTPSSSVINPSPSYRTNSSTPKRGEDSEEEIHSRNRSTSDPFSDPAERQPLSPSIFNPLSSSPELSTHTIGISEESNPGSSFHFNQSTPFLQGLSPPRISKKQKSPPRSNRATTTTPTVDLREKLPPPPQFRIFTTPSYLTNPELRALARLFPEYLQLNSAARIKLLANTRAILGDEESMGMGTDENGVKVGHGAIKIGMVSRDDGWKGTSWERFAAWCGGCFGR